MNGETTPDRISSDRLVAASRARVLLPRVLRNADMKDGLTSQRGAITQTEKTLFAVR
jgi:hypothetical protein